MEKSRRFSQYRLEDDGRNGFLAIFTAASQQADGFSESVYTESDLANEIERLADSPYDTRVESEALTQMRMARLRKKYSDYHC